MRTIHFGRWNDPTGRIKLCRLRRVSVLQDFLRLNRGTQANCQTGEPVLRYQTEPFDDRCQTDRRYTVFRFELNLTTKLQYGFFVRRYPTVTMHRLDSSKHLVTLITDRYPTLQMETVSFLMKYTYLCLPNPLRSGFLLINARSGAAEERLGWFFVERDSILAFSPLLSPGAGGALRSTTKPGSGGLVTVEGAVELPRLDTFETSERPEMEDVPGTATVIGRLNGLWLDTDTICLSNSDSTDLSDGARLMFTKGTAAFNCAEVIEEFLAIFTWFNRFLLIFAVRFPTPFNGAACKRKE
ncbi:asparagine--tRNA ligase [Anopheles sinensis]|uniref:Asparagine--tRNA ligase n=1 Tax=Anopheles sinensis TaxID=74873 RepID=A0A084WR90_ANOSI|nr:asparagine--tRNA ligase [Anopheles sinensis]